MKFELRGFRIAILLIGALLGLTLPVVSPSHASTAIDEQFQVQSPGAPGYTGYLVNNTRSLARFSSFLATFNSDGQRITGMKPCSSLTQCPNKFVRQYADINLTMCNDPREENCIRSIRTTNLLTKAVSTDFSVRSKLTEDFNSVITGDPAVDLPSGGNPLVVSIPSAPHEGGDLYLIKSDYYAARKSSQEKFKLDLITNAIYPVTVINGNFDGGGPNLDPNAYLGNSAGGSGVNPPPYINGFITDPRCIMATRTTCLVPQTFPANISFGLTLRANQGFTSWLYGRLANPSVSITEAKVDKQAVLVSIDAEPVKVPLVYGWAKNSDLPTSLLDTYRRDRSGGLYFGNDRQAPLDSISILKGQSNKYDESGIDEMLAWLPLLGDKAAAMPSQWSFQTLVLQSNIAAQISTCTTSAKSLSGLIFSNAAVFSSGAPTFDAKTGTLDYKVAAPHYRPDGSLMTGSYDLVLNSTVARCLYGFSKAPIGATVSIVNNDGQTQAATTVISEKDGFMRMGAYGFGFSSPTIKVKITQAGSKSAQSTITCVKGTLSKTVTGLNPSCPTGYKTK